MDKLFAKHRQELTEAKPSVSKPALDELSPDQIARAKQAYLHHLLDEGEEVRLDGFYDPEEPPEELSYDPQLTFEERQADVANMDEVTHANLARGKRDAFFLSEAEEVLTWDGIEL